MNSAPETEVKGAMLRITGKDEETVNRYYATFKTLVSLAKFEPKNGRPFGASNLVPEESEALAKSRPEAVPDEQAHRRRSEYH